MSRRSVVLGVDGGGNRTLCLVSDDLGNVLAQRQAGASAPLRVGIDSAAKTLFHLITKCCEEARCTPDDLSAMVLGLAGVERATDRKHIEDSLNAHAARAGLKPFPVTVETYARVALEGAFDGRPGVLLMAGEDSMVIGKTPKGKVVTAGGWGRILGDEGSGYYIGREALVAIAQHADRLTNAGTLSDVIAQKFHWQSREEIIAAVYRQKFDIASLAPVVLQTAANNDLVAQRIVQKAATLLAEQVRVVAMQMGILHKVGLVLMGTLLDREPVYLDTVHLKILKLLPQVEVRPALHSPAHGAVLIALSQLTKK